MQVQNEKELSYLEQHNGDGEKVMEEKAKSMTVDDISNTVYIIRGQQVMLDQDLADIYGYEVKYLNRQVKRNAERFPEDFMFQLTKEEYENLR